MMESLPDELEQIAARINTLERRVFALEHPADVPLTLPELIPTPIQPIASAETETLALAGGALPVLGRVMLGIAGAYLLRAVAESSSLPKLAIAAVAIAYAILWLVWATRLPAGAWFASTSYACTSALILAPMLWELTLVFKVLPAWATAGVLGAYACTASALAWRRNLNSVFWVPTVTAAFVALGLVIAARDMAPFLLALLLMAVLCEYAVDHKHGLGTRPWVAAAADLGILALIYLYSSPASTHAEYKEIGTASLLVFSCLPLVIYGTSVLIRTVVRTVSLGIFEIFQAMIAFLLAAISLLRFGSTSGALVLANLCLLLSVASYVAALRYFSRFSKERNSHVFSTWAAALFLAGSWLLLPKPVLAAVLGVAAIAAALLGDRLQKITLKHHALIFLAAAAVLSGLPAYAWSALASTSPEAPDWTLGFVFLCAAVCYRTGWRAEATTGQQRLLPLVSATLVVAAGASLAVYGLLQLSTLLVTPAAQHLAFVRMFAACLATLTTAYAGACWRKVELTRIAYAMLGLLAVKLVAEDLRHGHLEFIAASIFLFAVTLLTVPRLSRPGRGV